MLVDEFVDRREKWRRWRRSLCLKKIDELLYGRLFLRRERTDNVGEIFSSHACPSVVIYLVAAREMLGKGFRKGSSPASSREALDIMVTGVTT
jgi:hypothetical protein